MLSSTTSRSVYVYHTGALGSKLASDHLFQELVPPDSRPAARYAGRRRSVVVGSNAAAKVRRRAPQQEPLLLLLLLDWLPQVRRREVPTGGNLGRSAAAGCRRVATVRTRPGSFAGGSGRARSRRGATTRSEAPVAGAVRLHLRVPIRAVCVLGADGAGGAEEELGQEAAVAAHAADGGAGRRAALAGDAAWGYLAAPHVEQSRSQQTGAWRRCGMRSIDRWGSNQTQGCSRSIGSL